MTKKLLMASVLILFVVVALTTSVRQARSQGQKGYPKYCCTDAGVLGPYNNDSVPEGGACFGTKDGKRHEGKACYGQEEKKEEEQGNKGYPKYCCTDAGVLGPYNNDSVPEGGACFGTKDGKRHEGTACYGKEGKKEEQGNKGYPKYCCTDAGRLGPYNNDSVQEGGACFGTKDGKRYEGKACY